MSIDSFLDSVGIIKENERRRIRKFSHRMLKSFKGTVTVGSSSSCDFTSLQEAIDSLPKDLVALGKSVTIYLLSDIDEHVILSGFNASAECNLRISGEKNWK